MCGGNLAPTSSRFVNNHQHAQDLARLMERQLGYADGHIDSVALHLFIKAYWSRIATLAHAIHDDDAGFDHHTHLDVENVRTGKNFGTGKTSELIDDGAGNH